MYGTGGHFIYSMRNLSCWDENSLCFLSIIHACCWLAFSPKVVDLYDEVLTWLWWGFLKLKGLVMLKGYFVCFWVECIYLRIANFWDLWKIWNLNSLTSSSVRFSLRFNHLDCTTFLVLVSNLNCECIVQIFGHLRDAHKKIGTDFLLGMDKFLWS